MRDRRIIIAGGGTGGHIFPALAIGHALQRLAPGTQLLFVGAKGKMEMEKVPLEGFEIVGLDIAGFNRSNLLKNITLPIKLWKSYRKANAILQSFKPDAVVGVGGYASFPMLNAAQGKHIPTLIQEQNSYAGKSNQILAKKANTICVAYENMNRFFPASKLILTGNPVRKSIAQSTITREQGQQWLGINPGKKTVLVVGGSLGAKAINEAIDAKLEQLLAHDVQLIWQTGKPYHEKAVTRAALMTDKVKVFDFIREMEYAYAAADVIISRAGALAISELSIVAKPAIFVPLPTAAEDHQTNNAMTLVARDAAWMVANSNAGNELVEKAIALLRDNSTQQTMIKELKAKAITNADERIAQEIFKLIPANN